jgi:uncharacterized protein (DUF1800 family)
MSSLSYDEAAHLLRRAGFGGAPNEVKALAAMKREKAVDRLIDFELTDNFSMEVRVQTGFEFLRARTEDDLNDDNFNESEIRQWWLSRIFLTARPLEEKMTLFWHNHFATSVDKVPATHMYTQNLDLRRLALARFDDLLLGISRGAAMLIWLDGATSTKSQPNENFGREIQEVFSMSTHDVVSGEPNYTENDVKEIARAFTGWRFRRNASDDSPFSWESFVDPNEFDAGQKTIYGQTASFTGEDVITIIANRRAAARYLVKRLFEFFVYPLDLNDPGDRGTVEQFADVYFEKDHSIRELLRAILVSDQFFSERARFALVKTPVEYVAGAAKALRSGFVLGEVGNRDLGAEQRLRKMGMDLFKPPDVFGWKMDLGFVNSGAMLERVNYLDYLLHGQTSIVDAGAFPDVIFILNHSTKKTKATVDGVLNTVGPIVVDDASHAALETYLTLDFDGIPQKWKRFRRTFNGREKVILLFQLVMCLPEFQLK